MSGNQITAQSVNAGGRVAGKGALVTGGATGIGRACAERLAAEGAMVWVTDVAASGGAECVAAIREAGGTAEFMLHDVTQESAWQEVVAVIGESEQPLNILVNNAGIAIGGSILSRNEVGGLAETAGGQSGRRFSRSETLHSTAAR